MQFLFQIGLRELEKFPHPQKRQMLMDATQEMFII